MDALGHNFGRIFVALSIPGPPWAPFGISLATLGARVAKRDATWKFGRRKASPHFHTFWHIFIKTLVLLHLFSGTRCFMNFEAFREGSNLTEYCACQQNQLGIAASRLHPGSILEVFWEPVDTLFVFVRCCGGVLFLFVFFKRPKLARAGPGWPDLERRKWIRCPQKKSLKD